MKTLEQYIKEIHVYQESSLSRILKHINEHDTGTITAYRKEYTNKQNQQRNKSLHAKLSASILRVTDVRGYYIENYGTPEAQSVGEHVYFVTDWKDRKTLKSRLIALGEEFGQDSVLFVPKGGLNSLLIGTNHAQYPGYRNEIKLPILQLGKDNYEFLTEVKGRPFYFKEGIEIINETYCGDNSGLWAASTVAKKHWTSLNI